jgi:hypothetical protein
MTALSLKIHEMCGLASAVGQDLLLAELDVADTIRRERGADWLRMS